MVVFNTEWFLNRIKEVRPDDYHEYEFLTQYTKFLEPMKAKHKPCGNIISIIPNSFISSGSKCPICSLEKRGKDQRKTQKEFEEWLPEGVINMEKYEGMYKEITFHCFFCDSTYKVKPSNLRGRGRDVESVRCSRCSNRYNRTIKEVEDEIRIKTNGKYSLVSKKYKNANTPIEVKHHECGKTYKVAMHNFRKGRRCPHCNLSIGEQLIINILQKNEILYEGQKTFKDLRKINNLSYDFYLPEYNVLVEYQGEQHFKPVKHFGGQKSFEVQKEIDNIKRNYAYDNGYNLIEIPYTLRKQEDISKFLFKELKELF